MSGAASDPERAPELALVVGVLLAGSLVAFQLVVTGGAVLRDGESLLWTVGTAVALLYPFAAYAVVHDEDPTTHLPPRAVVGAGASAGVALTGYAALLGRPLFGLAVGLAIALPAAAYGVHAGAAASRGPSVPARSLVALAAILAVGVGIAGLALGRPLLGGIDAGAIALAGAIYHDHATAPLSPGTVLAGVLAGVVAVVAAGLALSAPLLDALLVATLLTVAATLYLQAGTRRRRSAGPR